MKQKKKKMKEKGSQRKMTDLVDEWRKKKLQGESGFDERQKEQPKRMIPAVVMMMMTMMMMIELGCDWPCYMSECSSEY